MIQILPLGGGQGTIKSIDQSINSFKLIIF